MLMGSLMEALLHLKFPFCRCVKLKTKIAVIDIFKNQILLNQFNSYYTSRFYLAYAQLPLLFIGARDNAIAIMKITGTFIYEI